MEVPTPERILLVRLSHLGDVVHGLPLLGVLRRRWPEAEIGWAVQPEFAGLLQGIPGLDRIFHFDRRGGLKALLRIRRALHAWRPDWTVDAQGNAKSALVTLSSGAPTRIGYAREDWQETWFSRSLTHPAPMAYGVHALHKVAALATFLSEDVGLEFDLGVSEGEQESGREALDLHLPPGGGPLFLLHLGVPGDRRSWPAPAWEELARRLTDARARVLILSGPAEATLGAELAQTLRDRSEVRHWVGQGGLRQLAAALGAASAEGAIFVGTDSGITHLAAAAGLPVVMLSGPQDPDRTGPWPLHSTAGSPHRVLRANPSGLGPMTALSPELVATALLTPAR